MSGTAHTESYLGDLLVGKDVVHPVANLITAEVD
jgi:hypothetical protein